MSSEQEFTSDSTNADGDPITIDPPTGDPPPEEQQPEPAPDPIPPPTDPIVYEPHMWYSITWTCRTVGCVNENRDLFAPMLYSNDGITLGVFCGRCNKKGLILTATLLDPQPEPE